jgi:putative transposase
MARLARITVPGVPHHVTQRGNRRQQTFFSDADYTDYIALMAEHCAAAGTEVWAYCLMPNHVHLILVPSHEHGLRAALGEAHRRYTRMVNRREGWTGWLWQGRFASCPMDESHLVSAARYVEMNPVRARLAATPQDWRWSSAAAHLAGRDDALVQVAPLLDRVPDWATLLDENADDSERFDALRAGERTGRPVGGDAFVAGLEAQLGRPLARRRPGRKPRNRDTADQSAPPLK